MYFVDYVCCILSTSSLSFRSVNDDNKFMGGGRGGGDLRLALLLCAKPCRLLYDLPTPKGLCRADVGACRLGMCGLPSLKEVFLL